LGTGHGASKQEAEQDAAKAALEKLVGSVTELPSPAKQAKQPRARRPRKPRQTSAPAVTSSEPVEAEVVPLHAASIDPPRSRQFGEPIE
jgi:hypothetical protein